MARASTIWTVQHQQFKWHKFEVIRTFTVKHECLSWLKRYMEKIKITEPHTKIKVIRYQDNQRDLDVSQQLDFTQDFMDALENS